MSSPVERNAFKLFVSIDRELEPGTDIMKSHEGYPIDNVIQIKLGPSAFRALFENTTNAMVDSASRYDAPELLARLKDFFSRSRNNYNNLASDITILVNNTYNDVDVNPVTLETACADGGAICTYFTESVAKWDDATLHDGSDENAAEYGTTTSLAQLMVYEVMARELDNMISRNILSTSEDGMMPDNSYDDLDNLYNLASDNFWTNLQTGDSIFVEGSFKVPTKQASPSWEKTDRAGGSSPYDPVGEGNLPIILQFVNSDVEVYSYTT